MHIEILNAESLPEYSIKELNAAIGHLLDRGFAPRFLLKASVSKPQVKKGHLWMSLCEGESSINAVVWASQLGKLSYKPSDGDGVLIIGKLNFWTSRATITVNVLNIKPSLTTVIRQFEIVKTKLLKEKVIDESRRRTLPSYPESIAILTSVPSSALADMLTTAKERWPLSKLIIVPCPVQGDVSNKITTLLRYLSTVHTQLKIDVVVIARGGGNREDLILFDNENLCREIAGFPVPIVTGIGHEDDTTVADLVADYRASTPTAAIVSVLPSRDSAFMDLSQRKHRMNNYFKWIIKQAKQKLETNRKLLSSLAPSSIFQRKHNQLTQRIQLLEAFSPKKWLSRGFSIVQNKNGKLVKSLKDVSLESDLTITVVDGLIEAKTKTIFPNN